jgi:hypothetical protein
VASHTRNRSPPEALAAPSVRRNPSVFLSDRGRRDGDLACGGRAEAGRAGREILGAHQGQRQANPELLRLALKLATGAGKTTVMAMLIAWQTVNAVRHPNSKQFSRGFLIVAPGISAFDILLDFSKGFAEIGTLDGEAH